MGAGGTAQVSARWDGGNSSNSSSSRKFIGCTIITNLTNIQLAVGTVLGGTIVRSTTAVTFTLHFFVNVPSIEF